jgi:hypothetical protein
VGQLKSEEEFRDWLKGKPRGIAAVLAARSALRVVPAFASEVGPRGSEKAKRNILPIFRCIATAWVVGGWPTRTREAAFNAKDNAYSAAAIAANAINAASAGSASAYAYAYAAASASDAASATFSSDATNDFAANASANAAYATANADSGGSLAASSATIWEATLNDANALEVSQPPGMPPHHLAVRPLWPTKPPKWVLENWQKLKSVLLAANENWEVWTDWYEMRLLGDPANEALEVARVTIPEEIWVQGPKVVNAHIKKLIAKYDSGAAEIVIEGSEATFNIDKMPVVPKARRAAVEPVWRKAKLTLPKKPSQIDLNQKEFAGALSALRKELQSLAQAVGDEANIDKRPARYFEDIAGRIPKKVPKQEELFRLGHAEEVLRHFEKAVGDEWPEFLVGRYHALLLQFDRTLRQSPTWREFKRNASKETLNADQMSNFGDLAKQAANVLREEEANQFVDRVIPESIDQLPKLASLDADEVSLAVEADLQLLAADIIESVNNVLKPIAEVALDYAAGMKKGFESAARKQSKKDGEKAFKWLRRLIITGAVGITGMSSFAAFSGLIAKYPEAFGWLERVLQFIK